MTSQHQILEHFAQLLGLNLATSNPFWKVNTHPVWIGARLRPRGGHFRRSKRVWPKWKSWKTQTDEVVCLNCRAFFSVDWSVDRKSVV